MTRLRRILAALAALTFVGGLTAVVQVVMPGVAHASPCVDDELLSPGGWYCIDYETLPNVHLPIGATALETFYSEYSDVCQFKITNGYFLGRYVEEVWLDAGYCNTSDDTGTNQVLTETYAQGCCNLSWPALVTTYHQWVGTSIPAQYYEHGVAQQVCMENGLGQTIHFVCYSVTFGPFE